MSSSNIHSLHDIDGPRAWSSARAASAASDVIPLLLSVKKRKFDRSGEAGRDVALVQHMSRQQAVEKVNETCTSVESLPVAQVRALMTELIQKRKIPSWPTPTDTNTLDKRTLCRHMRKHLQIPQPEIADANTWCQTLSKESVKNLRSLHDQIESGQGGVKRKSSSLTKKQLCESIGLALEGKPIHYLGFSDMILKNDDVVNAPYWMLDGVYGEIMAEPRGLVSGHTFDAGTIEGCVKRPDGSFKCPLTQQVVTGSFVNVHLKHAIEEWLMNNLGVTPEILIQYTAKIKQQEIQKHAQQRQKMVTRIQRDVPGGSAIEWNRVRNALSRWPDEFPNTMYHRLTTLWAENNQEAEVLVHMIGDILYDITNEIPNLVSEVQKWRRDFLLKYYDKFKKFPWNEVPELDLPSFMEHILYEEISALVAF